MESRPNTPEFVFDDLSLSTLERADFLTKIVERVGPRSYQLVTDSSEEDIRFFAIGCQGSGKPSQKETADLLKNLAEEHKPNFILFLGDNVYDYGVTNPYDEAFKTCFDDLYNGLPPCFVILGNHDGNFHAKYSLYVSRNLVSGRSYTSQGRATEINQVAHTYASDSEERENTFKQAELPLSKLPLWNMPYFFYSISIGNLVIFCINSNSYAKDYLALKKGIATEYASNQAKWLNEEFNKTEHAGKIKMIAMHHPLYTSGKRAIIEKFDSQHYLTRAEIDDLKKILGIQTDSYNAILANIFAKQGMSFECVLAAHDHFISYYNNLEQTEPLAPLCQFTSGGGGGDLQERESFTQYPYLGCHLKQNGFGMFSLKRDATRAFQLDVFTTEGLHLQFGHLSHRAIQTISTDAALVKLKFCVISAVYEFIGMLKDKECPQDHTRNYSGGLVSSIRWASTLFYRNWRYDPVHAKEILCAQHLASFFHQKEQSDFRASLMRVFEHVQSLPSYQADSFKYLLEKNVQEVFETSLNSLFSGYLSTSKSAYA